MKKTISLLLVLAMLLSAAAFTASAALEEYEQNWDVQLVLGENNLTLSTAAVTTVYEFCPDETGVYLFTVDDPNAMLTYWGGNAFFVWNQSETPAATLEQNHTQVGPSIMVGVSGVESCTLTVTRTGDAAVTPTYENVDYVNQVTPEAFTLPAETGTLTYVDVTDDVAESAVLGEDGYYHLNSANGPVLYVNISGSGPWGAPLSAAAANGAVKAGVYDEDGQLTQIVNYLPAWEAYVACKDATTGVYPLTVDLMTMYQHLGENNGWYDINAELGYYLFGENAVDAQSAWMFSCCYAENAQTVVPGDMTGDAEVNNADVVLLLWHTLFSEDYPIEVNADLTGDTEVNNADVVLLLWHTLFPTDYPL